MMLAYYTISLYIIANKVSMTQMDTFLSTPTFCRIRNMQSMQDD